MSRELLIAIYSVILIILVSLSFVFSTADMTYGSINIHRLEKKYAEVPSKRNFYALKVTQKYDRTISTLLLLNVLVNTGLDSLATLIGVNLAFVILGESYPSIQIVADNYAFICSMVALFLKVSIGEIIAKSVGKIYNYKWAPLLGRLTNALSYIFLPITALATGVSSLVVYPFEKNASDLAISDDELHEMVDEIEEEGQIDEEKAEILHGAIDYTETEAYEIMTPRVDVFAIDMNDDIEEVLKDERLFEHSRIPVYDDSIDDIKGFVHLNQLIREYLEKKDDFDIKEIMCDVVMLPRSTEINNILKKFKQTHQHFAVVLDEYGGTEGVVTMEDILEEIVGDIWDEKDDKDVELVERKDGSYIVDGMMKLDEFCEQFDIDYEKLETDYVTIAGFCVELLDDNFAKVGDKIKFKNLEIEVLAVDEKNTIEKLIVHKVIEEEE